MKRWSTKARKYVENAQIDAFLQEVTAVCKKHGFYISAEDDQGAFIIRQGAKHEWLEHAQDGTDKPANKPGTPT